MWTSWQLLPTLDMIMHDDLDLTALRVFRAVTREGSFAAASLVLRVPKSTVSKRIRDLEASLGVQLVERSTRRLRITPEGEMLLARADRLLAEAEDIRRTILDQGTLPRGHLRLSVPSLFGHMKMGMIGARLRALHPEITLECVLLDRAPDLVEDGFDAAIRFGPLDDTLRVGRQFAVGDSVPVAAPGLLGADELLHPADLAAYPLIGFAPASPIGWTFCRPDMPDYVLAADPQLALGSGLAIRDAAIAGAGIAMLPRFLAGPEIAAGHLMRVLPEWRGVEKILNLVYPSTRGVTARLRALIEVLDEVMLGDDSVCIAPHMP